MKYDDDIKPISYLKANAAGIIRKLHKSRKSMIITQNGEAKAVIQDITAFRQYQESLVLLKVLAQGAKDIEKGKIKPAKKVFTDIEQKITSLKNR